MPGPFEFLSRRRFLKWGLGVAALGVGGASGALWWLRGPVDGQVGLRALNAAQFRTFELIVAATFPSDGPIPVDASSLHLAAAFDRFAAGEPEERLRDLRRGITLVEVAPALLDGRGTTFSRMSPTERAEYWASWPTSERLIQRQASLGFRKFLNLLFYATPDVWPSIGYGGPSMAALRGGQP